MTFASAVSIKMSASAENRLRNIYFPGLPRHVEMISFPWRHVLIGREAADLWQRLMTNMGQWLCVWGVVMNGEKQGRWVWGHKDWHTYLSDPHECSNQTFFFFTTQWPVFSCVSQELCKWLWTLFSRGQRKKRLKWEKCLLLTFFGSLCCLWTTFHVGSVGLGCSSVAMWNDDGGCWVGGGGGSGHNDIYEELRRQARRECRPCCWKAWHWLMRQRKIERKERK